MELLFLGTSGSGITPNRGLPAQVIDQQILIDCGEGTLARLMDHNISPDQICAILITHSHADHFLGIISLLWHFAFYSPCIDFTQNRRSPPIYVPEGMKSILEQLFQLTSSAFTNVQFTPHIIELLPKPPSPNSPKYVEISCQNQVYSIEWIPTAHDPLCYAYRINRRLVISGDTHPFPEMEGFAKGCHTLVHEATFFDSKRTLAHRLHHSTPSDAAELAKKAGISQVILNHLPHLESSLEEETGFLADAAKLFSSISIAHDGDRIVIPD